MNITSIQHFAESTQYTSLIVLIIMLIEWGTLIITSIIENKKEGLVSILSYLIQNIPYFLLAKIMIVGVMFWLHQYRLFDLGYEWYVWIIAYLIYDFMVFFIHLLGHKVRIL